MSAPTPPTPLPTSMHPRSGRPTKKRALSPISQQQTQVEALFANPDRAIVLPTSSTKLAHPAAAPPEIVANVQGSSAGAGSGEFHVYKASRRREYERLRVMEEETEREERDREFEVRREEVRRADEEKLGRNRARREKARLRAERKKMGGAVEGKGGVEGKGEVEGDDMDVSEGRIIKKRLGAVKVAMVREGVVEVAGVENINGSNGAAVEVGITIHDDD